MSVYNDSFDRSDRTLTSDADWDDPFGRGDDVVIASNRAESAAGSEAVAAWNGGGDWSDQQRSTVTFYGSNNTFTGPAVHISGEGYYYCAIYANWGLVRLKGYNAEGTDYRQDQLDTNALSINDGDTFTLEALPHSNNIGFELVIYHNGTEVLRENGDWSTNLEPFPGAGRPGIVTDGSDQISAFEAEDYVSEIVGEVGLATESSTATPVTATKTAEVGQAVSTESAFAVTPLDIIVTGQAQEVDEAYALETVETGLLGLAVETDTALSLIPILRQAIETDTAFPAQAFLINPAQTGSLVVHDNDHLLLPAIVGPHIGTVTDPIRNGLEVTLLGSNLLNATVAIDGAQQNITEQTDTEITFTADLGGLPYGASSITVNDGGTVNGTSVTLVPLSGFDYVTVAGYPAPEGQESILDRYGDVEEGDQIEYALNSSQDEAVNVFEDGTFTIGDAEPQSFQYRLWDATDGQWSSYASVQVNMTLETPGVRRIRLPSRDSAITMPP